MKKFVTLLLVATTSHAIADESEFYVQEGAVKKIYEDIKAEKSARSSAEMSVGGEWLNLSDLYLKSQYFEVDYKDNTSSLQAANVGFATHLVDTSRFNLDVGGYAGYGSKKGSYRARSASGNTVQDDINLQWIPVRLKANLAYDIFSSGFVRPEMELGAGSHWFTQSGNLDGMTQSYWIPTYFVSGQLRFFRGVSDGSSGFSGLVLGGRFENHFSDAQKFSSTSYYLNANFKL